MPLHFAFIACNRKPARFLEDPSFIYRCENIAAAIESAGHQVSLTHISSFSYQPCPDIVVFHRPRISIKLYLLLRALKKRGAKILADVDDLIFDESLAEYSPAVLNGVLPYKTIFKRFVSHRRALALFDRITVSTTALARHAKKIFLGTKFAIIPNSVHHSWFGMRGFQERHRVPTITYFPGTRSHDRDFALVIEPLNRILASHPATRLFISGPLAVSIRARRGQVIHQQKVGFSKFHLLFKSGAINLAPLEATPFNQCKSALKLIEAGWWGIPTICSPTPDVRRFLDKDELTANNAAEWHDRLERLLLDRSYYAAVASNLRELVIKRADVHANAAKLMDFVSKDASIKRLQAWNYVPTSILRHIANRRRTRGSYNQATLWLFRQDWRKTRSVNDLLDYLLFRRDLGFDLKPHHSRLLFEALPHFSKRKLWLASALLSEAGTPTPALNRPGFLSGDGLTKLAPKQSSWRQSFRERVKACRRSGIYVIGNAGSLIGCALGGEIDRAGLVVRFNRFRNIDSNPEDIGKRLDVWVWAPGYHEALPDGVEWLAISGPDMCYRKRDWSALRPRIDMNLPVLTVPLLVWRSLVARLQAPPSAGVLMLAWLNQLIGSWDGITSVGIGIGIRGCYHHSDPKQQAAARHDWPGEQTLVHEWRKQGLRVLPQ